MPGCSSQWCLRVMVKSTPVVVAPVTKIGGVTAKWNRLLNRAKQITRQILRMGRF